MNKNRREFLKSAIAYLDKASDIVSSALEQESDCLDSVPENLQMSDRYEDMEAAVDCLEDAISYISDARDKIFEATA